MATADVKVYSGTPIVWNAAGTNHLLTLASLTTTATAAWQGAKGDLGTPRGARMLVRLTVKYAANPTAGQNVLVYWAGSPSSTATADNPGNTSGSDAVYAGWTTAAAAKGKLQFIGTLILEATTSAQTKDIGVFIPYHRYGQPVVYSESSTALTTTTTDHTLTVYPLIDQIQASA